MAQSRGPAGDAARPRIQAAGIQVLGLLEMRGLDFSRVFCLGLNSGALPAPPRPLPCSPPPENAWSWGAPIRASITLRGNSSTTFGRRPRARPDPAPVVGRGRTSRHPPYLGKWSPAERGAHLPQPAWLRSPAVSGRQVPAAAAAQGTATFPPLPLPGEISFSQVGAALACPAASCWKSCSKPGTARDPSGLNPRERGDRLHGVLASFHHRL